MQVSARPVPGRQAAVPAREQPDEALPQDGTRELPEQAVPEQAQKGSLKVF